MRRVFIGTHLPTALSYWKPAIVLLALAAHLVAAAARADEPTALRGRPTRPSGPTSKLDAGLRARFPAGTGSTEVVAVVIRLRDASPTVLAELGARGLTVDRADTDFGMVEGRAAARDLDAVAAHDAVTSVRALEGGLVRAGAVTSGGDGAAALDQVRASGLDGTGVTIGVLSDGLGSLAASQASGDLPQIVIPADPRCQAGNGNEGTAVLEIVHDVAPGATLLFASGVQSPLRFVDALECLVDAGADVIVDDIGFFMEPYFEDGVVAKAVRRAVAAGVSVHTAAGNSAMLHLEDDFRTSPDEFHDFAAGPLLDNMNGIAVAAGGRVGCALQWDERFGEADDDYDLELRDAATLEILSASRNVQDGTQDPLELATFTNASGASRTLGIAIQKIAGEPRRLKLFCFGTGLSALQYRNDAFTVVGHPAVEGVLAVGSIDVADPGHDTVEGFSARGPARIRFPALEARPKPDVVSFDGVATTVPGYYVFYGTSAAAPHTAGLAALLKQRSPEATGHELFDAITGGAVDVGTPGFDAVSGWGRVDGLRALAELDAPECLRDADCDDGDACTDERCESGLCAGSPPCDDGEPCNGRETCDPATARCRPGVPLADGVGCGDADVCNGDERCGGGVCRSGTSLVCHDADPCTLDGCDPAAGCRFAPAEDFGLVACRFVEPLPACLGGRAPRVAVRLFKRAGRRVARAERAADVRTQRRRLRRTASVLDRAIGRLQQKVARGRISVECADAVTVRFAQPAGLARMLADSL